ncbi:hypothetical protein EGR_08890 [Echinococcus granulosus]|uniref:Uncharacterized protein n=1 Tax=Echinococcus granulosus TaxID=6210 RepID=W6U569_ECHGR|nr:hypothetical protein EGR_08890 [Echinococcus granulosus]EUB56275.1 hypothetical protein EGR_08890 [Echinococcus granulosus]
MSGEPEIQYFCSTKLLKYLRTKVGWDFIRFSQFSPCVFVDAFAAISFILMARFFFVTELWCLVIYADSQDDEPAKPKKLAIGIPGGFELPEDKYTVIERYVAQCIELMAFRCDFAKYKRSQHVKLNEQNFKRCVITATETISH